MDPEVDAYLAQHNIQSVVSDMLFELTFHRPKEVGKFIAGYVERRFQLDLAGGAGREDGAFVAAGHPIHDDFATIEVRGYPPAASDAASEISCCAWLEEARSLRHKYLDFQPERKLDTGDTGQARTPSDPANFTTIPWSEFRQDYERLLTIFDRSELWAFTERRLAMLRGLFDAHVALNGAAEDLEVPLPMERVDNCVQLARGLSPGRLLELFNQKVTADGDVEVAPGRTLADLVRSLGRRPQPTDLTTDADAPLPDVTHLSHVFARTSNVIRGRYLAEAANSSFELLETSGKSSGSKACAEYRLPLFAETGAWHDLARWVSEFGVGSPRVRWVVQVAQGAYGVLKERRVVLNFGEVLENAFGPAAAASSPAAKGEEARSEDASKAETVAELLQDVVSFELAASPHSIELLPLSPESDKAPGEWNSSSSPPFVYQLYHMWARLKALNAGRKSCGLASLDLRAAANTAEPLVCAYLLGVPGVSGCAALGAHAPLQYLFALDGVIASVSLLSKRSFGGAGEAGVREFEKLRRAGVRVTLCTEDPTVSQQSDDALGVEYTHARTMGNLSQADLAEVAQNSCDLSGFPHLHRRQHDMTDDDAGAGYADSHKGTIRERYRRGRREAELQYIARLAPRAAALATGASSSA